METKTRKCKGCGDDFPVSAHRPLCNKCQREKYQNDPEYRASHLAAATKYRKSEKHRKKRYTEAYRQKDRLKQKLKSRRVKTEVIAHYSHGEMKCAKCPYCNIKALTIDHIDNDGAEHRRELQQEGVHNFYLWLRRNNYPEGFQVLCMNCQWEKRWDEGDLENSCATWTHPNNTRKVQNDAQRDSSEPSTKVS